MRSPETTPEAYLASLPPERRAALEPVLDTIRRHLPPGYEEVMAWGMIAWQVPLSVYPDTYNGQPFMYAGLASQKSHMGVYLTGVYADPEARERFEADWAATGKHLDMGRSCVRFKRLEDLPLDVIGRAVAAIPVDVLVARAKAVRGARR